MLKVAVLVAVAVSTTAHADGIVAVGGMAGFAPRSGVGAGTIEVGVPVAGGWLAHAMAAGGSASDFDILSKSATSGSFSQLRGGFGYRYSRKPGRSFELGVDVGHQHVEWSGTEWGFLGGGPSDVSYHHDDYIAVPRLVGALGAPDSSLELRVGFETAFAQRGWAGADFTLGLGFRL